MWPWLVPSLFHAFHNGLSHIPQIHVELIISDRRSDFVRDGIDFSVRIGGLEDQDIVLRPLGRPRRVTVASPGYLRLMGHPKSPKDLSRHHLIDHLLPQSGERLEWEFEENRKYAAYYPETIAAVGDSDARLQLAIASMGIVQSLSFIVAPTLREVKLERVLAQWETLAPEVSILYPRDRHLPARTLATMDAFAGRIKEATQESV